MKTSFHPPVKNLWTKWKGKTMSIIPSDLKDALQKTVVGFVVMEKGVSPHTQIHIVFSDNTSLEIWGDDIHVSSPQEWDIDHAEGYAKKFSSYVWRVE